ncbi:MAG: bifunctional phosphoglucose/phosphomannose isomerase [Carbonactinosporaceae bacterium]
MVAVDDTLLDDPEGLAAADSGDMLRAVASAGAQVRRAAAAARETAATRLAGEDRPRAVVVTGMGGSAIAGDVLAAVCGTGCPVPVTTVRGYSLPGWAGPVDLVAAVSCSGTTEETLSVAEEAARRGCPLLTVGAAGSPLAQIGEQARGVHVPVDGGGRQPRANIWALAVPLLVAAETLGVVSLPPSVLGTVADLLDAVAERCRPSCESYENPAKTLALDLAGTVPMVWGSGEVGGVAAYRFACQLNENAKYPAVFGVLPEAHHNQVVAVEGPLAASGGPAAGDFFRDRVEEPVGGAGLRLVLLRDTVEHPRISRRRAASLELLDERGFPVSEVVAEGAHPLERLAGLVATTDFASVYLALALGVDPTPIASIFDLKERIAR